MKYVLFILSSFFVSSLLCADIKPDHFTEIENESTIISADHCVDHSPNNQPALKSERKKTFGDLCAYTQAHIVQYLDDPLQVFWLLTKNSHSNCKELMKFYLIQTFDIPELESVKNYEPEFKNLLNVKWCRKNRFVLFGSLMEDISSGKQKYKTLLRSLLGYLARIFKTLDVQEQAKYETFCVENYKMKSFFASQCAKFGFFDLVIEILPNPSDWYDHFKNVENMESFIGFFKSNPQLALQYQRALIEAEFLNNAVLLWLFNCIIYDAPEHFFSDLLSFYPELPTSSDIILFHSLKITDTENYRIHSQMKEFIKKYAQPKDRKVLNLKNDIRFGGQNCIDSDFSSFSESDLKCVALAAFATDKINLFFDIYESNEYIQEFLLDEIIFNWFFYAGETTATEKYKIIFELLQTKSKAFDFKTHLKFIMNFYAYNRLISETSNSFTAEFVVLENTPASKFGFPPRIQASFNMPAPLIFYYMKVFDKATINKALSDFFDYQKRFVSGNEIDLSIELLEMISKSPKLVKKLIEKGFEFTLKLDGADYSKRIDLLDFKEANQIISPESFNHELLTKLESEKQFEIVEKVSGKAVADFFADRTRQDYPIDELVYIKWRSAFAYWIKSDQRERIRNISSPHIIEFLRLEFPKYMNELLGPV